MLLPYIVNHQISFELHPLKSDVAGAENISSAWFSIQYSIFGALFHLPIRACLHNGTTNVTNQTGTVSIILFDFFYIDPGHRIERVERVWLCEQAFPRYKRLSARSSERS